MESTGSKRTMLEVDDCAIAGMDFDQGLLWFVAPKERLLVACDPATGKSEQRIVYPREVWDVATDAGGLWLITGGGKLGRQIVFWSLLERRELREFDCPDGAASGLARLQNRLWLTHRHNRKLFCLDADSGKVNWVIRTDQECFSPAAFKNELWLIESDPGPLGHWSQSRQGKYFFSRYDPVRERIVEQFPVPFVPCCMAYDGERFWYSEQAKRGLFSTRKS
jgi:outer membrane protein assembly factor BamB